MGQGDLRDKTDSSNDVFTYEARSERIHYNNNVAKTSNPYAFNWRNRGR